MVDQAPLRVPRRSARAAKLAFLAAMTVIVTGCGGGGGSDTAESTETKPGPGLTAWERVLEGVGDDGTVDKETALAAFSLAIAPLPGVDVPEGDPGPIPDGSGAVAWVLRRYDELTPEQQQAVGAALGGEESDNTEPTHSLRAPGFSSDVQLAVSSSPSKGCYGQPLVTQDSPGAEAYRPLVDEMIGVVGERLGGHITMDLETFVVVETRTAKGDTSDAFTWADPGDCSQKTAKTCTIHFNPSVKTDTAQELRGVVAHEVMHCYVFAHLGVQAYDLPPWIGEGLPGWVGETVADGTAVSARWWRRYLTNPTKPLFSRVYDAIGFYAHLDETGIDPWQKAVPILSAFDSEPAWEASVGSGNDAFLDSWPTGFARDPARGEAWDTKMNGITADKAPLPKRAIRNGQSLTEAAPPGANQIVGLAINADVLLVESESSGRLAGGGDEVLLRDAGPLCLRDGGCECPEDSEGAGQPSTDFSDPELLAVTGGLAQGTVKLRALSLDDFCGRQKTTTTPAPASKVDACMVGRWVTTRIEIVDEVTGAPATELGGGDGVVMTISRAGDVVIDHNAMNPIRSDVSGIAIQTIITGVSHATIEAANGQVTVLTNDFSTTATARVQSGPLASRPLPGTPVLGSGPYQCSSGTLELSFPYPLGTAHSSFRKES